MDKKILIMLLGMLGIVTFPVKIIMQFVSSGSEKSTVFAVIFSFCVFAMMFFSSKLADHSKVNYSFKNFMLSGLSIGCALSCIYTVWANSKTPAPSDAKFQYLFLSIFSAVSAVFFLFVAYSHFSGKNAFRTIQFLVFAPVIMYIASLTCFFSFEIEHNAYDLLGQCLTLLFFVYYSHFYVKCSNKNFRKRCLAFGIPGICVNLCYFIPTVFSEPVGSLSYAFSIMSILISAYIGIFLVSDVRLSSGNFVETKIVKA